MNKLTYLAIVSLIIFVSCEKSEVETLPFNNLEPNLIRNVLKVDSVIQYPNATYKRINIYINRGAISSWNKVENVVIKRSMGSVSTMNKDFSFYQDLALYPSGPAWVVLHLRKDFQSLSAPSDTFYFNVP